MKDSDQMKFCSQCGKYVETDEQLCPICGFKLQNADDIPQDQDDLISIMLTMGNL